MKDEEKNLEVDQEYAKRLGITVTEYRKRKAKALNQMDNNVRIITDKKNTSDLYVNKEEAKSRGR